MKLGRNWLNWMLPTMCLNGVLIFAQEPQVANVDVKPVDAKAVEVKELPGAQQAPTATVDTQKPSVPGTVVDRLQLGSVLAHAADPPLTGLVARVEGSEEGGGQGKYWIGLICNPPSEGLRVQLDLPAEVGLIVDEVTDGGPAMKAGIQRHDLLLSMALTNKPMEPAPQIRSRADLVNQVQAAENNPIKIEFLRRGRKQMLEVIPVERPKTPPLHPHVNVQYFPVHSYPVDQIYQITTPNPVTPPPIARYFAGPMVFQAAPPLPDGMSIEYHDFTNGQPERVTVKRGDQTWEALFTELGKLPQDVRAIVSQQVEARRMTRTTFAADAMAFNRGPGGSSAVVIAHGPGIVLPNDVTVTIVRHGSEPARVNIKKGDQSWDATDKELGKLPEEIRPYAEMSLTGHVIPERIRARGAIYATTTTPFPETAGVQPWNAPVGKSGAAGGAMIYPPHTAVRPGPTVVQPVPTVTAGIRTREKVQNDVERQLKELTETVEKLRQAVEKSQSKQ